jgi:hypothetical protein
LTASTSKQKEHSKSKGKLQIATLREMWEKWTLTHRSNWGEKGPTTSEEVTTDVVGAAGALELAMEPGGELRLSCCNFMINIFY